LSRPDTCRIRSEDSAMESLNFESAELKLKKAVPKPPS
jgi:hypothetical protein